MFYYVPNNIPTFSVISEQMMHIHTHKYVEIDLERFKYLVPNGLQIFGNAK